MLQKFDPKNENIQIYVNGKLFPRSEAKISVFDSVVQGGDAVWEGLRVYNGKVFCWGEHLNRLIESAHALCFEKIPSIEEITKALRETLIANEMYDQVHVRLTLTRGEKITSGMDPRLNTKGCSLIILAEHKPLVYDNDGGISVITSSIRRNNPQFLDSKIHHNNLLNNILAKIQANVAGVDAALMLDNDGFAAELNGTNIFMIKGSTLYTPFAKACLPGITRDKVIQIAGNQDIECWEKDISLTELYNADMVFATGTMGELTPVIKIDGRDIKRQDRSAIFTNILSEYHALTKTNGLVIKPA